MKVAQELELATPREKLRRCLAKQQADGVFADQALDRRRATAQADWMNPEAWQSMHSPTEDVMVRYRQEGKRTIEIRQCRRRLTDARLWDGLTHEQQQAASDIEFGYRVITHGLGVKLQSFERRDKSHNAGGSGHAAALSSDYIAWAKAAQLDRIDHAAIMLVLAEGMAPSRVDTSRRRRRGYTRGQLIDGLNLYCKQQGWPIQPATTP